MRTSFWKIFSTDRCAALKHNLFSYVFRVFFRMLEVTYRQVVTLSVRAVTSCCSCNCSGRQLIG